MYRLTLITMALTILIAGCSSGNNPVVPVHDLAIQDTIPTIGLMGAYELILNPDKISGELTPKRTSATGESYTVSGIGFFTTTPCSDCLKISSVSLEAGNTIVLGMSVRHPFPKGDPMKPPSGRNRLDLDVFDLALLVAPQNRTPDTFSLSGTDIYSGICADPDGYTAELADLIGDNIALPYFLVIDDSDTGTGIFNKFEMGSSAQFDIKFDLSTTETLRFDMYLTMGYGASAKKPERLNPKYYNPEFNRKAAWKVKVFPPAPAEIGSTWDDTDSSTPYNVVVHVYDWQQDASIYSNPSNFENAPSDNIYAASDVSMVSVEIPGMTNALPSVTSSVTGAGTPADPLIYHVAIANENLIPAGQYTGLVTVKDQRVPSSDWLTEPRDYLIDIPDGLTLTNYLISEYATYQTFTATVVEDISSPTTGNLMWAKRAGGGSDDTGAAVTKLSDGTIVITGDFPFNATFGPGETNQTTLTSAGMEDIFVARYNSDGTLLWAKRAGGASQDWGFGITALSDNSVIVTGFFREPSATFGLGEPTQTTLTSAGWGDVFIAKYNSDGTFAWAKRAGGAEYDYARGITTLSDDSFAVTGEFTISATFGPGEPSQTLLTGGDREIFVARYNADGTLDWAKRAGSPSYDSSYAITSRSDDSTAITGFYASTAIFGPGEPNQTSLATSGSVDIFIACYNPDGTLAWAKKAGGTQDDLGQAITTLSDNSTVATGYYENAPTFGPGELNQAILPIAGGRDIFIARYNIDGTLAWVKHGGGTQNDTGYGITTLSDDSIVATGCYSVSSTFGQGDPNETTVISTGQEDIVIARYNSNGTLAWAKSAGGLSRDFGRGIASLSDNSTVAVGTFGTSAVFGPGETYQTTLNTAGSFDIFIARFAP